MCQPRRGADTPAKAKLTFLAVALDPSRKSLELQREIPHFSVVQAARGQARVPLRATVKWRIDWN